MGEFTGPWFTPGDGVTLKPDASISISNSDIFWPMHPPRDDEWFVVVAAVGSKKDLKLQLAFENGMELGTVSAWDVDKHETPYIDEEKK